MDHEISSPSVVTVLSSRGGLNLKLTVSTSKSPKGACVEVTHPIPLQNHVQVPKGQNVSNSWSLIVLIKARGRQLA